MTKGTAIYAVKRLCLIVVTVVLVASVTFVFVHALAGDPFSPEHNPASGRYQAHVYGLDKPLLVQYRTFVWNLLHGDLGYSYVNLGVKVTPLLLVETKNSVILGLGALSVTVVVGVLTGITAALRQTRGWTTACPDVPSQVCPAAGDAATHSEEQVTGESLAQPVVIGVDTHDLVHVAVAVDQLGHRRGDISIPATPVGYERFVSWTLECGSVAAVAMEGTGSYGRGLCALLQRRGVRVVEVVRPSRQHRRNRGKSDLLDAEAAARAFLGGEATAKPRGGDADIAMIRSLRVAREAMVHHRTQTINQLRALIVTAPADLRQSLAPLSAPRLIQRVARFRIDGLVSPADASRFALRQLGRHVRAIDVQIEELNDRLTPLVANRAPELLALHGVGVEVAGNLLVAWDNAERIRSEAAFAAFCGVAPIPASSGKTSRHRLSRGGDRSANRALWRIVLTRLRTDDRTREYVARRRAEGKSHREVVRCLKRYVAREVFHILQRLVPTYPALDAT